MRRDDLMAPVRSALFVPGHQPDRVKKALNSRADAVIIELEDAVPLDQKESALETAAAQLGAAVAKRVFVRVNSLDSGFMAREVDALVCAGASCLMIPKVDNAEMLGGLDKLLSRAEQRAEVTRGHVKLMPLIESAAGVFNIGRIVLSPVAQDRVWTVALGAADYSTDAGVELSDTGEELLYPRSALAVACRAAGLAPPVDTPYMLHILDEKKLAADALRAKRLGFQGKLCVHPKQVAVINRVFSPSDEELEHARRVLDAFEKGSARGLAAVQLDGKFIDKPVVDKARKILGLAGLGKNQKNEACE